MRCASVRSGVGVAELLVALLLTAGLVSLAWALFASQRRVVEGIAARADLLTAERVTRVVITSETRAGLAGQDWRLIGPGVMGLRAFRGWAAVCTGSRPDGDVVVRYEGQRAPEPDKDSVLSLEQDGSWMVAALVWRGADHEACPGAGSLEMERWRTDPPLRAPVILRVFESGSYHLEDGALRYRIGLAGRQPMTPPAFDPGVSGFGAASHEGATLRVYGRDGIGGGWRRTLAGNGGGAP